MSMRLRICLGEDIKREGTTFRRRGRTLDQRVAAAVPAAPAVTSRSKDFSWAGSVTGGWQVVSTQTRACALVVSRCGIVSRKAGGNNSTDAILSGVTRRTDLPKR